MISSGWMGISMSISTRMGSSELEAGGGRAAEPEVVAEGTFELKANAVELDAGGEHEKAGAAELVAGGEREAASDEELDGKEPEADDERAAVIVEDVPVSRRGGSDCGVSAAVGVRATDGVMVEPGEADEASFISRNSKRSRSAAVCETMNSRISALSDSKSAAEKEPAGDEVAAAGVFMAWSSATLARKCRIVCLSLSRASLRRASRTRHSAAPNGDGVDEHEV